jgi:hypothetical protein
LHYQPAVVLVLSVGSSHLLEDSDISRTSSRIPVSPGDALTSNKPGRHTKVS